MWKQWQLTAGRWFFMGFSHFYVVSRDINNICSGLSLSGCLLLRSLGKQSISLQRREYVCLLSSKIKMVPSWTEFWTGLLVSSYKRRHFPKLWYKPDECAALCGLYVGHSAPSPWDLGAQGADANLKFIVCCCVNNTVLCVWPRSLISSARPPR